MRRRVLPIAAVALAGLLVGGWLAMSPTRQAPRTPPPPLASRPHPAVAAPAPAPLDTGDAPPPLPSPTTTRDPSSSPTDEPARLADMVPMGIVRCTLSEKLPASIEAWARPGADILAQGLANGFSRDELDLGLAVPLTMRLDGDWIEVDAPVNTPLMTWRVRVLGEDENMYSSLSVRWEGEVGQCSGPVPARLFVRMRLAGRVEGLLEGDSAWVSGCGGRTPVDAAGRFETEVVVPGGTCLLHAARRDGAIYASGPMIELDADDGDQLDLVLELPDFDVGGLGVPVDSHPDGMRLGEPSPGSPAARAGLVAGDVIVGVDGESVAGWDLYEIIAAVTGPIGTSVDIVVRSADGDEESMTLDRSWIDDMDG